jgi:dipeptidyl aminopeptidase/acylaminoacyl peptidase
MGFAVLQVNYRGSTGFGAAFRLAGQKDIGNTPAQDVLAAIDWTINHRRIDSKRLAILGQGFGGYVALRVLQLRPESFRAAISIDGVADLNTWLKTTDEATESRVKALEAVQRAADMTQRREQQLSSKDGLQLMRDSARATRDDMFADQTIADEMEGNFNYQLRRSYFGSDLARLDSISPALHPESIKSPVFIIQNMERQSVASQSDRLRRALASHSIPRAELKVNGDFDRGSPEARAQVFTQIEEFLNVSVYDYRVKFGDLKIVR